MNKPVSVFLLLYLAIIYSIGIVLPVSPAQATPEYAQQTASPCGKCHVDAIGGGKLTFAGEQFLAAPKSKGLYRQLTTVQHAVRLFIGYFHLLAAIVWFGTIIYVHLLLKPAYASQGLPRGELRLGMLSMVVILVTGVLLTIARMPDLHSFYTTRFGILLSIKIILFLVMLTSALITATYIGPRLRQKLKSPVAALISNEITPEQLTHFDGQESKPAYISYKGMVYNVTNARLWKNGAHMVKHLAGNDLTEGLKNAPHGEDKILAMTQVGMLVTSGRKQSKPFHEHLFYFFAYMNLALIFVIVLIISLWRWW